MIDRGRKSGRTVNRHMARYVGVLAVLGMAQLLTPGTLASGQEKPTAQPTYILHHIATDPRAATRRARFEAAAKSIEGDVGLRLIETTEAATAYRITRSGVRSEH